MVRVTSRDEPAGEADPERRGRGPSPPAPRRSASARTTATISARVTPRARSIPIVARRWTTENVIVLYARKRPTISARSDSAVRFTSKAWVSSPTNSLRAAAGTTSTPGGRRRPHAGQDLPRLAARRAGRGRRATAGPAGRGPPGPSSRRRRRGPRSACALRASSGSIRPTTRTGRDRPLTRSTTASPGRATPSSAAVSRLSSTAPGSVTSGRERAPAPRPRLARDTGETAPR